MCQSDFHLKFCTCSFDLKKPQKPKRGGGISYEERLQQFHNYMNPPDLHQISDEEYHRSTNALETGNYLDKRLVWYLRRLSGEHQVIDGIIIPPKEIIGGIIGQRYIVDQLNADAIFDFDYTPKEDDIFTIQEEYIYEELREHKRAYLRDYMTFKFDGNKWWIGRHDVGVGLYDLGNGTIEMIHNS